MTLAGSEIAPFVIKPLPATGPKVARISSTPIHPDRYANSTTKTAFQEIWSIHRAATRSQTRNGQRS